MIMTQEEKAKRFDEALEQLKGLIEGTREDKCAIIKEDIIDIFPELAESEDERIRKDIIVLVKDWWDRVNKDNISTKEQMLAWLEKQSNSSPVWKYKKDNNPLIHDSLILNKYGCVSKSPSGAIVSDVWVLDYDELATLPREIPEKQGQSFPILSNSSKTGKEWTEEDDKRQISITEYLNELYDDNRFSLDELTDLETWLNSLKQRMEQ